MITAALALLAAAVALVVAWVVTFIGHLTADDRRYRKNLRRDLKP